MSGYGGRPPGWDDPYGQQGPPPGPYDPSGGYGQYGPPPPGPGYDYSYGYGPPGVPYGRVDNSSAIAALVCNIVATALCCNIFCIGGIVTAAIAMGRTRTEPETARKLVIWSWVIFGASMALEVILFVLIIFLADGSGGSEYGSGSGI